MARTRDTADQLTVKDKANGSRAEWAALPSASENGSKRAQKKFRASAESSLRPGAW